jgi:hypothetical protein
MNVRLGGGIKIPPIFHIPSTIFCPDLVGVLTDGFREVGDYSEFSVRYGRAKIFPSKIVLREVAR